MGERLAESPENDPLLRNFALHLKLQRARSPRTVDTYLDIVRRYLAQARFEPASLRNFLRDASAHLAPASHAQWASALKTFVTWALQEKIPGVDAHLLKEIQRPRVGKKLIAVVDEEDLPLLVKHVAARPPRERLLFELLLGSGLRISEAQTLTWDRIDLATEEIRVLGKGAKIRRVPLTPGALRVLAELRAEGGPGPWAQGHSVRTLRRWVENWGKSSLLDERTGSLHPHKLRHSLATQLLRRGARLPQIQKLLGHSRLATTERYTHLNPEDLVRAYDLAFPDLSQGDPAAVAAPRTRFALPKNKK